ncbi:N-acetyltransferase [Propionibacterium freudenreichii]|uniref:GNAT family N-acetyltransferase n=1 Tax=Propionibacterium freudenreichii TaxID=1744 RepID=UPI0021A8CC1C|nr:GNAT family N-acetyltransferase [Propionibacterium freudenreichii]MCT2999419.1 N-acetyltransferase [Propionibacterium freudenreichii]
MPVIISPATREELAECAHLLMLGFASDPFIERIVPPGAGRRARLTRLYELTLRTGTFRTGVIDVARCEPDGAIVGAASWQAPNPKFSLARAVVQAVGCAVLLGPRQVLVARRLLARLEKAHPAQPNWYLEDIAVHPDAGGAGIGAELLAHRLGPIDAGPPLACCLEATTPGAQRLYERFGFRPSRWLNITPDGYPMAMRRPVTSPR